MLNFKVVLKESYTFSRSYSTKPITHKSGIVAEHNQRETAHIHAERNNLRFKKELENGNCYFVKEVEDAH